MFTANWWINAITPCTIIFTITYYFCVSTFKKWEKLNVPCIKPIPLFGNFWDIALGKAHPLEFYGKIYNEFSGRKYGGLYQMRTPYLMVRDPEMINDMLIKDFSSFPDRGIYSDFVANPLSNGLFFMENPQWKTIRNKLTPAFTSGKLKTMYDQIKECGDELMKTIDMDLIKNGNEIEIRDIMGKYSTDVIGTCAFGLKLNAINDDESPFRKYGKSIFTPSLRTLFRELCLLVSPALLKVVRVKDFPTDATDFFHAVFKETITYRLENKIVRNDFVQCLIQARNDLVLNADLPKHEKFTESQIVANAFAMFAAGFETVSSTISYCLYELALNKSIQDRLRKEIQLKLSKNNGQINPEFLMDLNYLDMVIAETLRKYPPLVALFRKASQTYRVPDDSLIIEKGQKIIIPIYALHYDSKHFTDPEKFNPERFSAEEKANRPNGIYLPFGDGPRICIGKRFAEMEMKLAFVEMLTKFEVFPCDKTEIPLKYSNNVITLVPKNGIWLTFKRIN
ncbi:probable cytochrome P450 6a13 [Metopolophium dirhodum]|uniref:probable cytochrome P450 6a13 n=1 Tax=Metopolophium dirhodum TaxID=44670 RepID=UPI0029902F49|nr:probable cytochrome P450 6a13 [Metopolophium dirhodum]